MKHYTIERAKVTPAIDGAWDGPAWADIEAVNIDQFHEKSSDHQPVTKAKVVYDDDGLYVIFRAEDQYVRSVNTGHNCGVCRDSCAEFFFEPIAGHGYFNIEINCGGHILMHYNSRSATIKYDDVELNSARLDKFKLYHSMPDVVEPEITEPTTWYLEYFIPFEIMESYVGTLPPRPGTHWRGNFYKCADQTSHPHWAMWNRVGGTLGFHKPEFFAPLYFE